MLHISDFKTWWAIRLYQELRNHRWLFLLDRFKFRPIRLWTRN
jgi:hypothetical protein